MHHKQGEAYTHRNYLYCRLTIRCKTKLLPRQSTILEYSKLIAPLHRCFSADVRCSFKQKSSLHTQRLCITTIAHDVPYRQIKVDCCRVPWYRCISTTEQHHARGSTGHACPLLIVCTILNSCQQPIDASATQAMPALVCHLQVYQQGVRPVLIFITTYTSPDLQLVLRSSSSSTLVNHSRRHWQMSELFRFAACCPLRCQNISPKSSVTHILCRPSFVNPARLAQA